MGLANTLTWERAQDEVRESQVQLISIKNLCL